MRTLKIISIGLFIPLSLYSQSKLISTVIEKEPVGYPWITQLEQGATDWDTHIAFRVVVQTEETFNSVFLEKITFGDEGCCTKVASTREFDLRGFAEVFAIKGTLSGFEFVSWKIGRASCRERV